MLTFFVPGVPVPKQSFRVSRRGHFRDPRVTAWQNAVAAEARRAWGGGPPMEGELAVDLFFVLPDRRRKDLENLAKGTIDACNGLLWEDDSQIVKLTLGKMVGPNVGVRVEVTHAEEAL